MLRFKPLGSTLALAFALGVAVAKPLEPSASAASMVPSTPQEPQLVEHGHYINKSGAAVHSPTHTITGQAPAGASAKCRDGTFSFSQHHRGACSDHGGVAGWL